MLFSLDLDVTNPSHWGRIFFFKTHMYAEHFNNYLND